MKYSAPLPIEQAIQEKQTFHLNDVFKERWRVFKGSPLRFFIFCFPVLILRDVADFLYPMTGVLGEALFWSFLFVYSAYLTWSILRGHVGTLTSNLPSWATLQNPYLWGLILASLGILIDWYYDPVEEQLSRSEGMLGGSFLFSPSGCYSAKFISRL